MGHSFLFARWRWAEDLGAGAILAACFFGSPAQAQQFAAPSCGNSLADSTCYTAPTPNNCSLPDARISERGACPAGYVGMMDKQGTRDSCTGAATFAPGGDESGCTNCGSPLSQLEAVNMQRAILEVSESANQAYVSKVCSGFSCLDGASVNDLVTGQPIGRIFRDHVWVAQDGFSSGYLPTTNRVKYLSESNQLQTTAPAFNFLAGSGNGPRTTSVAQLYSSAKKSAEDKGLTSCSGDGKNGCSLNCSQPPAGWQGQFCATKTVQHWSCSDSYAVNSGGAWQPTKDASAPFTEAGNYDKKTWSWPEIFAWNSPSIGKSGGAVYMCNSTINACNGWVTQKATYKCRAPATYDCSYSSVSGSGLSVSHSGSCQTCSPDMGAVWDFELLQANDCPATPASTRTSSSRAIWQADLAASSCPVNGSGTGPAVPACQGGQLLDATGTTCACKPGFSWNGSSCEAPPPPGTPPAITFSPLSFSKGVIYTSVPMGSLSSGVQITSLGLVLAAPGSAFPPGMFPHFLGSLALISGMPNTNGTYAFAIKADYASGLDAAGNRYPAGVVVGNMSVTVTGCGPQSLTWTGGANTCSGSVGNSAEVGPSAVIPSTSASPINATGSNALSCNLATGSWASTSSTCAAPAAPMCNTATIPGLGTSGVYATSSLSQTGVFIAGTVVTKTTSSCTSVPGASACGMTAFKQEDYVCGSYGFDANPCRQLVAPSKAATSADQQLMACPGVPVEPAACPANDPSDTFCTGTGVGGGGAIYRWGHYVHGPAPACAKTQVVVGSARYGSREPEGCPAPWGDYVDPNLPSICPLIDGTEAKVGQKETPCRVGSGSTGYRQGSMYTCTATGWSYKAGTGIATVVCD